MNLSDVPEIDWDNLLEQIFTFKKLQTLFIANNNIAKVSPSIKQCQQIANLDISGNKLAADKQEFWELMAALPLLKSINLANNNLQNVSNQIKSCSKLERINLDNNSIEVVSDAFGELSNLQQLSLNRTAIKTIPTSMVKLKRLKKISLEQCASLDIKELLNCLKNNTLEELNLSNANIESFPEEIPNIKVRQLILKGNALKKSEIKRLIKLLPNSTILFE